MKILSDNISTEVKNKLAKKLMVENKITDLITLSRKDNKSSIPLWSLAKFNEIYEMCLVINSDGRGSMFSILGEFLVDKGENKIVVFPVDGWIDGLDFGSEQNAISEKKISIELSPTELRLIKSVKGWEMPPDIYFFPEDFSWLLFSCHERFQILCSNKEFMSSFKSYWKDYEKFIDKKWTELFKEDKGVRP